MIHGTDNWTGEPTTRGILDTRVTQTIRVRFDLSTGTATGSSGSAGNVIEFEVPLERRPVGQPIPADLDDFIKVSRRRAKSRASLLKLLNSAPEPKPARRLPDHLRLEHRYRAQKRQKRAQRRRGRRSSREVKR